MMSLLLLALGNVRLDFCHAPWTYGTRCELYVHWSLRSITKSKESKSPSTVSSLPCLSYSEGIDASVTVCDRCRYVCEF